MAISVEKSKRLGEAKVWHQWLALRVAIFLPFLSQV